MSLKKDLFRVVTSNAIVLLSSVINGLILPSILTVESFSELKTYTLFASFIGFLHLGFVDGINVKYGGIDIKNINREEFGRLHAFFLLFQIVVVLVILCSGIIFKNGLIVLVGLATLPINIQCFFLFFYQAVGEFKDYARATVVVPISNIVITLSLVLTGIKDYRVYIIVIICSYIISVVLLEAKYLRKNGGRVIVNSFVSLLNRKIDNLLIRNIFKSGFYIMFGNVLFTLFFDTGRWVSKFFTSTKDFAVYSLGLSLIGFIVVFIAAVNKAFYPYLHRNQDPKVIGRYKNTLYILSSFSLAGFFILRFVIEKFLAKYLVALPVTAILITSIPGMMIIKSIYVNLYKVQKQEKYFLLDTLKYLLVSVILCFGLFYLYNSLISIAFASVIAIYVWAIFPVRCVDINYKVAIKEILFIGLLACSFYFIYQLEYCEFISISILCLITLAINIIFYKETLTQLISQQK